MENLVKFLQDEITDEMSLEEIVNVFERMCAIPVPVEDDMILFETGTFPFTDEPLFQISLVRQFRNNVDDEFYQIHVEVSYKPTIESILFTEVTWSEDLNENISDYIRKSKVFAYAKNKEYIKTEIYLDQT